MAASRDIRTLELESTHEDVRRAARAVRDFFQSESVDDEIVDMMELAVSEAATNVVRHAYGGEAGHPLLLKMSVKHDQLEVVVLDKGRAMAPDRLARAEMPSPVDENISSHGRGLAIMKSVVDEVRYGRNGQWNELVLIKRMLRK